MADQSLIEWTDATWNPITGCSIVSPGCTNCYAMKLAGTRLKHHESRKGLTRDTKAGPAWTGEVRLNESWLDQPLRWTRPRRIFVCAHGDLFAENVPDEWIDRVFAVMALAPQHTFQVLTKRARRMRDYVNGLTCDGARRFNIAEAAGRMMEDGDEAHDWVANAAWPLPNVWIGVSAEDQQRADERIPDLLATPAAVRFISAEPLLGPIHLGNLRQCDHCGAIPKRLWDGDPYADPSSVWTARRCPLHYDPGDGCDGVLVGVDWVIVGGESGQGARPMHPAWVRSLRDQCADTGTAFFFKQWGEWGEWDTQSPVRDYPDIAMSADGQTWRDFRTIPHATTMMFLKRIGKKAAGRRLDGVEHNAMPEVAR